MTTKKIYYLDNLKVLLTVLVVLHHTFITYGASGGWYYKQPTDKMAALIPMTMFVAINQAFFMGFFFFISAYLNLPFNAASLIAISVSGSFSTLLLNAGF